MIEHLEVSTDIVKSNKKLIGAIIINIILLLVLLIIANFMPNSIYMIALVFCLEVIGVAFLLYQIVRRI